MASPYEYELQIDMRENYSMGYDIEASQLDDILLKCTVTLEGSPFDLTNYTVRFQAKRPDGNDYIQNDPSYISKGLGYTNINCDNRLTVASGKCVGVIHIYDTANKQATTRYINLKIKSDPLEVNRTVTESTITAMDYVNNTLSELNDVNADLTDKINEAKTENINLTNTVNTAVTTNNALNTGINTANSTKQALETSNSTALATKSAVDASITNANTAKSNLDGSVNISTVAKTNLDASSTIAQGTLNDLHTEVVLADQKITDLQNFDPNSVVQNTNIMLGQMYCDNKLLSINHNLNGYPDIQLIYTQYGAGVGGAGNFPAGANSECNKIASKIIYTDNNNIDIYVPDDYYITNISINKINDYKYIVTSSSSTKSILIQIKL